MTIGKYKPVAIHPLRIFRIVLQVVTPQHLGNIGHAHRRAGMSGIGFLDGVHGEGADGVGEGGSVRNRAGGGGHVFEGMFGGVKRGDGNAVNEWRL